MTCCMLKTFKRTRCGKQWRAFLLVPDLSEWLEMKVKNGFWCYLCLLKEQVYRRYRFLPRRTLEGYSRIRKLCEQAQLTFSCSRTQNKVFSILWKRHNFRSRRVGLYKEIFATVRTKPFRTMKSSLFPKVCWFWRDIFRLYCLVAERFSTASQFGSSSVAELQQSVRAVNSAERTHLGDISPGWICSRTEN